MRSQEDYIYELEDYVVEYSDKLRQCRCVDPGATAIYSDAKALAQVHDHKSKKANRPATQQQVDEAPEVELPIADAPEATEQMEEESPQLQGIVPEDLKIPEVDISEPVGSNAWSAPDFRVTQADHQQQLSKDVEVLFVPDPANFEEDAEPERPDDEQVADAVFATSVQESVGEPVGEDEFDSGPGPPIGDDRSAKNLVIAQLLRGTDDSENPGSLLAVVEARDSKDEPVDLEGEVSLMVMTADPDAPKRLRRWDFTGEETTAAWQSSDLGDGLHLELPLGDSRLPSSELEIWARLVSPDGGRLLTQRLFDPQGLPTIDTVSTQEETLPQEKPLLAATDEVGPAEVDLPPADIQSTPTRVATGEPDFNILRPATAREKSPDETPKPATRWRASMERSHSLSEGFSTTARGALGWSAQRTASRMRLVQPARPVQRASTVPAAPGQAPD